MKNEKSKRVLLEELLVKYGEENRSSTSTIKSSASFRYQSITDDGSSISSSSSTLDSFDSNDLLAELVRRRLAKTKTKKKKKKAQENWYIVSNLF